MTYHNPRQKCDTFYLQQGIIQSGAITDPTADPKRIETKDTIVTFRTTATREWIENVLLSISETQ